MILAIQWLTGVSNIKLNTEFPQFKTSNDNSSSADNETAENTSSVVKNTFNKNIINPLVISMFFLLYVTCFNVSLINMIQISLISFAIDISTSFAENDFSRYKQKTVTIPLNIILRASIITAMTIALFLLSPPFLLLVDQNIIRLGFTLKSSLFQIVLAAMILIFDQTLRIVIPEKSNEVSTLKMSKKRSISCLDILPKRTFRPIEDNDGYYYGKRTR